MKTEQSNYQRFQQYARELADLKATLQLLSWDQETMMPSRGSVTRAQQISTLAALYHEKLTSDVLGTLIEDLQNRPLEPWGSSSVRELKRQRDKAVRVPQSLVRELAETISLSYEAWVQARKASDFLAFRPWLEKVVYLKREEARCIHDSQSLYEALLDDYEPQMMTKQLDQLFERLRPYLTSLLNRVETSPTKIKAELLRGNYPRWKQEEFGRQVLTAMGFDWEAGRLDVSPHPFSSGFTPFDVRITTRYCEEDFSSSFFGMVHEGGHALYEQGLDPHYHGLPACEAISMGIHESQSRLWENQIARSSLFWEHWLPALKKTFPELSALSLDDFVAALNRVEASLIRVDADEVTYGLHVILRYQLEKQLIEGDLSVGDLEEAWKRKMQEFLGIVPLRSAEGVLQDTHWSQGLIGYFPTYVLGNLYAAQVFFHARQEIAEFENQVRKGELRPLREWLREKIHIHGKTVTADQLIKNISGRQLDPRFLIDYLEEKFTAIYRL
ncbi:MAG: carboxypeptidase M32 [Acidobacteria bacterium]|nr:carboxypeptidase M32 [Acidobacteriota bacterium]